MAELIADPARYLEAVLGSKAKILLVNPPVQERRYHWLRWNQPLELLRLSSWLKARATAREVRLFDFMLPDERGDVPRHKIKETWTGPQGDSLWHFGAPFENFGRFFDELIKRKWIPDLIVVSSLTAYWHVSVEKLLVRICNALGPWHRAQSMIALYGAYPLVEPEHAAAQPDANVAFTGTLDASGLMPNFGLYLEHPGRLPNFFALDIEDPDVPEYVAACLALHDEWCARQGVRPPAWIEAAFFSDDLAGPRSQLNRLADQSDRYGDRLRVGAICGVRPASMSSAAIERLTAIGAKSFFVEYATQAHGRLDEEAYGPFREFLAGDRGRRREGAEADLDSRDAITAFVNIGLPSDDLETIVRNTLLLNRYFGAIILKPFGYSPDIDPAPAADRRARWPQPAQSSPQWFPYVGRGSDLTLADYDNLMRWQGLVNKRVKSFTFDFLGDGAVPKLVRETLIEESWKRQGPGR